MGESVEAGGSGVQEHSQLHRKFNKKDKELGFNFFFLNYQEGNGKLGSEQPLGDPVL